MHIHPAIASLRNDRSAQRAMQDQFVRALSAWRSHNQAQVILDDLEAFGAGVELDQCAALDTLLSDHLTANAFVQIWQRSMIAAAREYPLANPDFRYRASDGLSNIVLLSSGAASLNVIAYEERSEVGLPQSAVFSDRQTHECVLSGSAEGLLHEVRQCDGLDTVIDTCTAHWRAGAIIVTKGPCEARQVVAVNGAMQLLQLTRTGLKTKPTREYSLRDGALLKTVSGERLSSEKVMALAVLGAMEADCALDVMQGCALNTDEDPDVRWEAVRQTLAMHAARGIALLETIECCTADPLSLPAQDLRIALHETKPELAHLFGAAA